MMRIATLALVTCLATSTVAEAQWVPPPPSTADTPPHVIFGGMSVYGSGDGVSDWRTFAWRIGGYFRPIDSLELGFVWGFAHNDIDVGPASTSAFMLGNPYFQVAYRKLFRSSHILMRVGGGIAAPVARVDNSDLDSPSQRFALLHAGAMYGGQHPWLWLNETVSFVLPNFRLDGHVGAFVWAADTSLTIAAPTGDQDTEVYHQLGGEAGGRFAEILVAGGRLGFLFQLTEDVGDAAQVVLEPFFRIDAQYGFFELRLTMNLDRPFGFAFDDGRVWAVHFTGGGRF